MVIISHACLMRAMIFVFGDRWLWRLLQLLYMMQTKRKLSKKIRLRFYVMGLPRQQTAADLIHLVSV